MGSGIVILALLLIVSLAIHMIQALWAYRRNNRPDDTSPDYIMAMDNNPCYEASNVLKLKRCMFTKFNGEATYIINY